jgi:hypothetical protein
MLLMPGRGQGRDGREIERLELGGWTAGTNERVDIRGRDRS